MYLLRGTEEVAVLVLGDEEEIDEEIGIGETDEAVQEGVRVAVEETGQSLEPGCPLRGRPLVVAAKEDGAEEAVQEEAHPGDPAAVVTVDPHRGLSMIVDTLDPRMMMNIPPDHHLPDATLGVVIHPGMTTGIMMIITLDVIHDHRHLPTTHLPPITVSHE